MSGPDGLEFLLVSVHGVNNGVNNNHNKVYVGIWYRPPANSAAIDTWVGVNDPADRSHGTETVCCVL